MQKLYVYADFDWLDAPQLLGELSCDSVRGNETYGFSYNKEWLAEYGDIFFGEDLQSYPGIQYTKPERDIFA
ncbi:MAG: type II toxin-antitoxin system HipA family toxin, partial [Bacteroidales bacterium]|nr:type II toxin-antitoxin system HipA family toxin [Bacteroidales bacterium]